MVDGRAGIFAKIAAHPADSFAANHEVRIDQFVELGNCGDVPTDDDGRFRRQLPYPAAHLAHLAEVGDDAGNADDVVLGGTQLPLKAVQRGKVEQGTRGGDVVLNHHQAPGAVKHAQRKTSLLAGDLIVIQLHGVYGAAAEFVVARIRAEHRTEQDARVGALCMRDDASAAELEIMLTC